MSESKHTPWGVYENEVWTIRDDGAFGRPLFKSRMREDISWAPAWPRREEDKALALAASAPDLLEALKHVDYLLNELADERTPANVEMTPAEAALVGFRKHTRAAIAKATGGRDE